MIRLIRNTAAIIFVVCIGTFPAKAHQASECSQQYSCYSVRYEWNNCTDMFVPYCQGAIATCATYCAVAFQSFPYVNWCSGDDVFSSGQCWCSSQCSPIGGGLTDSPQQN